MENITESNATLKQWVIKNPIKSALVILFAIGIIGSRSSKNQAQSACENDFLSMSTAEKIDYSSGFNKSLVNSDGTVSSILQGYKSITRMSDSPDEGWKLWRCESAKNANGEYEVTSLRMIDSSEANALIAESKK